MLSAKNLAMGRPRLDLEGLAGRHPRGTRVRIKAILAPGEKQSEFLRVAVEKELRARERAAKRKSKKP